MTLFLIAVLSGCSSITPVVEIGPKKLAVYTVSQNDFLTANRMLVILDKKGNVVAYTGGSVAGIGSLGVQLAGPLATAGAVLAGSKAIQHGLENAAVNVKGIPSTVNVNGNVGLNANIQAHYLP